MANDSMVLISGAVPDMTLLTDREPPQGIPSPTPGAPTDPPAEMPEEETPDELPGAIGGGEERPEGEVIPDGEEEPDITLPEADSEETPEEGETGAEEETGGQEEGEDNESTENTTEMGGKGGKDDGKTGHTEVPASECTHGAYPYICIGTGVLSLVLIVAVILQALRLRSCKKRIASLSKRKGASQPEAAAVPVPHPVAAAPSDKIQVGKFHAQGARSSQQDSLAVSPLELYGRKGLLALVADGMGGLSDGDRMSQAAASAMLNGFVSSRDGAPSDVLLSLTMEANQAVNRILGPQNQGRSGTTLVAGLIRDGLFHYVSVGDSRICLYRQGLLTQLNREHVYRNELATQAINGAGTLWDANTHPKAGALTSYLGMGNLKYVDIPAEPVKLRGGDKIILMSDGIYNALSPLELESALAKPAQQAADTIGQMVHAKNFRNQDNYTAVVLEF